MSFETDFFPIDVGDIYGYINRQGQVVCPAQFSYASHYYEGLAYVRIEKKRGFIDTDFNVVILDNYEDISSFSNARAVVKNAADEYGVMDKTGKLVVPFGVFSRIYPYYEGFAAYDEVHSDGKKLKGFINLDGDVVLPAQYNSVSAFSEGVARVDVPGSDSCKLYGFIDPSGDFVIEPKFSYLSAFSEGLALASLNNSPLGFIDHGGNFVIEPQFRAIAPFSEGFAQFENAKGIGFIDTTGKTVIEPRHEIAVANDFKEGRLLFRTDTELNWSGYLDRTGEIAIPVQFIEAHDFQNGLALVTFGKEDGNEDDIYLAYIDKDGKVVWRR